MQIHVKKAQAKSYYWVDIDFGLGESFNFYINETELDELVTGLTWVANSVKYRKDETCVFTGSHKNPDREPLT